MVSTIGEYESPKKGTIPGVWKDKVCPTGICYIRWECSIEISCNPSKIKFYQGHKIIVKTDRLGIYCNWSSLRMPSNIRLRDSSSCLIISMHRPYTFLKDEVAIKQRTLTPPDTLSCPTLGLSFALMLRPFTPEIVMFSDSLSFEQERRTSTIGIFWDWVRLDGHVERWHQDTHCYIRAHQTRKITILVQHESKASPV